MNKSKRIWLALVFMLIFGCYSSAYAGRIELKKIISIESRGNSRAYNSRSKARGLCQITPICLREYNNFHKSEQYTLNDLWNPEINKKIAIWYLEVRIPQMLKYYGYEISVENIIISYNAGIDYVVSRRELKQETIDYINKYRRLK